MAPRIPRRTITTVFISTLSVAGLGWIVFGHEPFMSKLEPLTSAVKKMMRGGRVPTVPTDNNEWVILVDPKWSKTLCHFQGSRRAGGLNSGSRRASGLNSSNNNSSNNPEEYNQTVNFAQRSEFGAFNCFFDCMYNQPKKHTINRRN